MAKTLTVRAYGDPILKKVAAEVKEGHIGIIDLIDDMFETMYVSQGVGLAAPQIGESLRLFVVDTAPFAQPEDDDTEDDKKDKEFLKTFKRSFINPKIIEEWGDEWAFNEGCLSLPTLREDVLRKSNISIAFYNSDFKYVEQELSGLAARVFQHEYDHLDGIVFTDRLNPLKRRLLKRKLTDISKGLVDVKYKMLFPLKKRGR